MNNAVDEVMLDLLSVFVANVDKFIFLTIVLSSSSETWLVGVLSWNIYRKMLKYINAQFVLKEAMLNIFFLLPQVAAANKKSV